MPRIKACLFDLGNTLVHFTGNLAISYQESNQNLYQALLQADYPLDQTRFLIKFDQSIKNYHQQRDLDHIELTTAQVLQHVIAEFGHPPLSEELLKGVLEERYKLTQSHWQPEKDCLSTITSLHKEGIKIGIVSNAGDDPDVQVLVDKCQIRPYLDFVISSAAFGTRKPDSRIFQHALEHWGFSTQEVAMIGDNLIADVGGANRLGIFSIWINRRTENKIIDPLSKSIQPKEIIDRLDQLPALIESIGQSTN